MNDWSRNRKRFILFLIFFVVVVLIGVPVFFLFYRTPSCFDGKQNGDETGIDCGGSCQLLCSAESLPLISKGDPKVLNIAPSVFEIVALMENPNASGEVYRAGYTFKLYDAISVIPIKVVEGETFIPRGATFAVFEGPFTLEAGINPTRATLEWKEQGFIWRENTAQTPLLKVSDLNFSRENSSPRLDANIENTSLGSVSNIDLVALVYNETGSIFAASKTFVDILSAGEEVPLVFTSPMPFSQTPFNVEIITRVFPDRSFIR